jgi:hypothetical protein
MRNIINVLAVKYNYNGQMKEDDLTRSYRTHYRKRIARKIWMGKLEGKEPLGRPRHG